MKRGVREKKATDARVAFLNLYADWLKEYEPTCAEVVSILSGEISGMAKYLIRMERHGDTEEPGGTG